MIRYGAEKLSDPCLIGVMLTLTRTSSSKSRYQIPTTLFPPANFAGRMLSGGLCDYACNIGWPFPFAATTGATHTAE